MTNNEKGKAKRHFFLAVEIPPYIADQIYQTQNNLPQEWHSKEKRDYHCTLAYFGHVADDRLDELKAEISKISYKAFPLHISGFDCFHRTNSGRKDHVLFAKFNDAAQSEVKNLHSKIIAHLRMKKFKIGRLDIHPHITIRKVPQNEQDESTMIDFIRRNEGFKTSSWMAEHMVLYESLPHHMRMAGQRTYFEETRMALQQA